MQDLLVFMGVVESSDSSGLDGSGTVTNVGTGVSNLQPGDRVFYFASGCLSTGITIPAPRCVKIPQSLSWEDAATMPLVYATVIHSLLDMACLQAGQSIMIHSACSGVGIAALNICRSLGVTEVRNGPNLLFQNSTNENR